MEPIKFQPSSPDWLSSEYKGLREPNEERDNYSCPLADGIMTAIQNNLRKYAEDQYSKLWRASIFPERLTKEILRLVEQQFERSNEQ